MQAWQKVFAILGFNHRSAFHVRVCVFLLAYHVLRTISDLIKIISPLPQATYYPVLSTFPKNNLTLKPVCYQSLYFFNSKLFKSCFKCTNGKHRLRAERRSTEVGSYPVIFPSFGLPTAPREDLPVCGCPSKRGLENHLRTWPLRNRQMLQRGVLSGHPNWAVGSGTALGFLSAKQSICYWSTETGIWRGKKNKEKKEEVQTSSNTGMLKVTSV